MKSNKLNAISGNFNGIPPTMKKLKIMHYFKNILLPRGISFLQETHFTTTYEASW